MTREEAISILCGVVTHYNAFSEESEAICMAIKALEQTDVADTNARPKGKWLYHRASNGLVVVKCSECKKTYGFLKTNYCPYCGADMRGDNNETD